MARKEISVSPNSIHQGFQPCISSTMYAGEEGRVRLDTGHRSLDGSIAVDARCFLRLLSSGTGKEVGEDFDIWEVGSLAVVGHASHIGAKLE